MSQEAGLLPMLLTIDVEYPDRPVPDPCQSLNAILEVVATRGQPVGFLVQGRWAMAHPDLVTRMAALDPDLGLHGYAHVNHSRLHVRGLAAELADGLAALRAILPYHEVRFCRFPYGDSASRSDATALLVRHGLTAVGWDYASRDWDVTISDAEAWERIRPACVRGGVVLFHSWVPRTARLIARLLDHEGPAHAVRFRDIPLPYVSDHGLVYLNPQA